MRKIQGGVNLKKGQYAPFYLEPKHYFWVKRKGFEYGGISGFIRHLVREAYGKEERK